MEENNKGQITIFLAVSLIIIMTTMAFIINIGLFVKAKINLQNAVDAGAFAGASVQARQLSQAGHLNWEMRNTYKEWMFKYYVLGNRANNKTVPGTRAYRGSANKVDFTAKPFWPVGHAKRTDETPEDQFNVPSVCIHFGTEHNLCEIASIPGLPRFKPIGIPSISDQHESFINALVATKSQDCSRRTTVNFGTAMLWAYGTREAVFEGQTRIAANRTGAFPEALELAIRMRNIEAMINRAPVESICRTGINGCSTTLDQLDAQNTEVPVNERPIKAFVTAYRNLGSDSSSDIKRNFILKEIPPTKISVETNTLSGFLIPSNVEIAGGLATDKYYVDLQIMPFNFANFFHFFSTTSGKLKVTSGTSDEEVDTEARCTVAKTAIPIPAYPFGFIKNPEVLTYYAVEGQSKFVGLFYPFTETEGIQLRAYSAAKPFGGRIGPRLASPADNQKLRPRDRSSGYISALQDCDAAGGLDSSDCGDVGKGEPIPSRNQGSGFWVTSDFGPRIFLGGVPGNGDEIRFSIPNLIYDYNRIGDLNDASNGDLDEIIKKPRGRNVVTEKNGLYDKKQFELFAENLEVVAGTDVIDGDQLDAALEKVRRPTKYEALNYLIPTRINPNDKLDSVGFAGSGGPSESYSIYAPLFGPGTLYEDITSIIAVVEKYISDNRSAIQVFLSALEDNARDIISKSTIGDRGDIGSYQDAADLIYNLKNPLNLDNCAKTSIAAMFNQFFLGTDERCGIKNVTTKLSEYYSRQAEDQTYKFVYRRRYNVSPKVSNSALMSAYVPGPRTGGGENGEALHPFEGSNLGVGGSDQLSKRNYYSTKFIPIQSLAGGSNDIPSFHESATYQEVGPNLGNDVQGIDKQPYKNILDLTQLEGSFGALNH